MSVQMNFSSSNKYELIEYPGLVKNTDKMISSLGGMIKISRALGGESKRLELRFHPDNPYNKPLNGESSKRTGLLLSIKVRKSKRDPNKPPQHTIKILGYINKNITFESPCDFQYLPLLVEPNSSNEDLQNVIDKTVPKSVIDFEYFEYKVKCLTISSKVFKIYRRLELAPMKCRRLFIFFENSRQDVQLLAVPTSFCRQDMIHTSILLRGDFSQEDGQCETLGVLNKYSSENRDMVAFNVVDPFPTRPDPQILKKMKVKYVSDEQLQKVKQLFEECPIWTRIALLYESGISNDKLKCITPSLAYYFTTGPWRTMYVRYGYDPRRDFNSRYFQTFDFRLRYRSGVSEFIADRKTTIKNQKENPYEINSLTQDVNYPYFEEHKLPRSRQCMLRYCDIQIPKIQEMLEKIPSPMAGAICNERTGWLPPGFDGQVRQILSNSIKELLKSHYRKEQIHAELDTYENEDPEYAEEEDEDYCEEINESMINDEQLEEILDDMKVNS